ncbi:MAG: four helix bundle protein [Bdellovibrionota bacterium]
MAGVGRYSLKEKIHFWRISKGSLFECIAILDLAMVVTTVNIAEKDKLHKQTWQVPAKCYGPIRWAEKPKKK